MSAVDVLVPSPEGLPPVTVVDAPSAAADAGRPALPHAPSDEMEQTNFSAVIFPAPAATRASDLSLSHVAGLLTSVEQAVSPS